RIVNHGILLRGSSPPLHAGLAADIPHQAVPAYRIPAKLPGRRHQRPAPSWQLQESCIPRFQLRRKFSSISCPVGGEGYFPALKVQPERVLPHDIEVPLTVL